MRLILECTSLLGKSVVDVKSDGGVLVGLVRHSVSSLGN